MFLVGPVAPTSWPERPSKIVRQSLADAAISVAGYSGANQEVSTIRVGKWMSSKKSEFSKNFLLVTIRQKEKHEGTKSQATDETRIEHGSCDNWR
jgi:hypothetical protein